MKEKKMILGIGIAFLFLATVSFTYAYFTTAIVQNEVKNQVVTTGTLELTYTDGPEIKLINAKPGDTITKTISVNNTGTLATSYNLVWQELDNHIARNDLVFEATCVSSNGTCEDIEEKPIKINKIVSDITINPGEKHTYNIIVTFKETDADQNYNQSKKFSGVLGIEEYKDTAIYCVYDGDVVDGATFVDGQYTYSYNREPTEYNGIHYLGEANLNGWSVQLADKSSTDKVDTKLCTYINNIPVVSMAYMFYSSSATEIDMSSFNTSNIVNMQNMFESSKFINLDFSTFDTSKVTNMSKMFYISQATALDLSNFDTSKVTNMSTMFAGSKATTIDLRSFDTSNVTSLWDFLSYSNVTEIDMSGFDTSKVTQMTQMFNNSKLKEIDVSNFDFTSVSGFDNIFRDTAATKLYVLNQEMADKLSQYNLPSTLEVVIK